MDPRRGHNPAVRAWWRDQFGKPEPHVSFDPAQMVADGSTVPLAPDGRVRTAAACVERMPLEAGFDTGFAVGERHGLRFVRVGSR